MRDTMHATLAQVTLYGVVALWAFVAGRQVIRAATEALVGGLPW